VRPLSEPKPHRPAGTKERVDVAVVSEEEATVSVEDEDY
jgi:hypothetical protein